MSTAGDVLVNIDAGTGAVEVAALQPNGLWHAVAVEGSGLREVMSGCTAATMTPGDARPERAARQAVLWSGEISAVDLDLMRLMVSTEGGGEVWLRVHGNCDLANVAVGRKVSLVVEDIS